MKKPSISYLTFVGILSLGLAIIVFSMTFLPIIIYLMLI